MPLSGCSAIQASTALPKPYQPGSISRHCAQLNTQWIARKSSISRVFLREEIFGRIRREWHLSIETLLDIMGQERLLQGNSLLDRSIRNRFPYLDPLNHVQVELLKEHRAHSPDEQVLRGIQLTINGISAGLRNSG